MSRTTLLILGASGDLTERLLLPGLGTLLERQPDRSVRVVGVARRDIPQDDFRDMVGEALSSGGAPEEAVSRILEDVLIHRADVTDAAEIGAVLDQHAEAERLVIYFATAPWVTEKVCRILKDRGVGEHVHLALEKPFGDDLESAEGLNALVEEIVSPDRAFRIDHFLGMTPVIDLITARCANRSLRSVWNAEHIESVEIAYDEDLALENRAGYYDEAGALVDMFQSHMLQMLALVAMAPPTSLEDRDYREAKDAVLRSTRLWGGDVASATRRGRYTAGRLGDREIPSYVDEDGVDPSRETETLAQVMVEVADETWTGVPFVLRSGKAIGDPGKHVVVTFRPAPGRSKDDGKVGAPERLVITFEPATMELRLLSEPGEAPLALSSAPTDGEIRNVGVEAYGHVITAILDADPSQSVRGDTAEHCWRLTGEILAAWKRGEVPMEEYPAGSPVPADWGAVQL